MITELKPGEIFVFGSNLSGRHGKGAALYAKMYWGAANGIGQGPTGRCYAIPTKDHDLKTLSLKRIQAFTFVFLDYARRHPEKRFLVTEVGCGLAGYKPYQIAPFFRTKTDNVILSDRFQVVLDGTYNDPGSCAIALLLPQ